MRLGVALLVMVGLLGVVGCGGKSDQPYFTIDNRSGKNIKHLVLFNAGPALNFRKLDANTSQRMRAVLKKGQPTEVVLTWELTDGELHHEKIQLTHELGLAYDGPVKFTIDRSMEVRVRRG